MSRVARKKVGRRAGSFRTCAGCQKRIPRSQSFRLVRSPEGACLPDLYKKLPGRGMHLCPDLSCFIEASERRSASRSFRQGTQFTDPRAAAESFLNGAKQQVMSMLSVAARSGWISAGRTQVEQSMQSGQAALVLVAADASRSVGTRFCLQAEQRHIPFQVCLQSEDFSQLRPGKSVVVLSIHHRGMARRLLTVASRSATLTRSFSNSMDESDPIDSTFRPREYADTKFQPKQ